MDEISIPSTVTNDLKEFLNEGIGQYIAEKLFEYDAAAQSVTKVATRRDRATVVHYRDKWDERLTFVINLSVNTFFSQPDR